MCEQHETTNHTRWNGFWGSKLCFWCERLEERHALVFFLSTHGVGWGGVGLCSRSFNLHTLVMHTPWMLRYSWGGVGWGCVHVLWTCTRGAWGWGWGGGVMLTFNWSRTPTWCYAQLLHLHERCHVGVERFWDMPLGGFGRLLTVNMIGCNCPRSGARLSWLALEISRLAALTGMSAGMTKVPCTYIYIYIQMYIYVYVYIYIYKYAYLDIYKYRCV